MKRSRQLQRVALFVVSLVLTMAATAVQAQGWDYTWWHYCRTHNLTSNGGHTCTAADVSTLRACVNDEYMPNGRVWQWDVHRTCQPGEACVYHASTSCTNPQTGIRTTFSCQSDPGGTAEAGRGWLHCHYTDGTTRRADCGGWVG